MEHYSRGRFDSIHFKFAIQHLSHGTELLLKQRLAEEHPLLIWDDVSKPGRNAVGWEVAAKRLTASGVDLSPYLNSLNILRALRNRIEHFEVDLREKEAATAIGGVLDFVFEFPVKELSVNLPLAYPAPKVWQRLLRLRELRRRAEDTANTMLAMAGSNYRLLDHLCIICASSDVVCAPDTISGGDAMCLLCGHRYRVVECHNCERLRPEETSILIEEAEPPVHLCGQCIDEIQREASRYEDRAEW